MKKLLIGLSALLVLLLVGCATPNLANSNSETELKKACDLNEGNACTRLGNLYRYGEGVKQDYLKAKMYYSKACNLNDNAGCNNLGGLYFGGTGVKKDYSKASKYYTKACDLNEGYSCWRLGGLYYDGRGVKKDYAKAKKYFAKSCNLRGAGCTLYKDLKSKGY